MMASPTNWDKKRQQLIQTYETDNKTYQSSFDTFLKSTTKTTIKWISHDFSACTLPDTKGNPKPTTNTRILRYLQQYQHVPHAVPENTWPNKAGIPSHYTCPLEVQIWLGGRARVFNIMDQRRLDYSDRYSVYIQTHDCDYPGTVACPTYELMVKYLQDEDARVEKRRVELILDALTQPKDKQAEWESALIDGRAIMGPQQIRAAVELIAATHIAECVPTASFDTSSGPFNSTSGFSRETSGPSDSTSGSFENSSVHSDTTEKPSNIISVPFVLTSASGGAPAMDKWARRPGAGQGDHARNRAAGIRG